jgi:2-polyprenyl-3-methyl-5-hydroxy-6-metoxy-1,4-benzoquinol methylase
MNQEKIWNYFQKESSEVFSHSTSRLNYLFKQAQKKNGDTEPTVLNIGVGNAWLEKRCMEQGWKTYSLDPSQEAIKSLETSGFKGKVGYIEKNPYTDDFFDIIFCSEVIEHLSDEQINIGLLEIERVLKKGGVLIGTVPYKENLLDNQVVCPKCGEIFHKWGHQQSFDVKSLIEIFPQNLTVQEIRIVCFVNWKSLNWKGILSSSIKKGLSMVGIHGSDENILFVVKK